MTHNKSDHPKNDAFGQFSVKKISAKKSVEKNHPFFDVAERSTFPQPPVGINGIMVCTILRQRMVFHKTKQP